MLALDIGSSSVKALVLDPHTFKWWTTRERYGLRYGAGMLEVCPDDWWRAARAAISAVLKSAAIPAFGIGHIALAGNMSSVVLLDGEHRAIRNAILLADERGEPELASLPVRARRQIGALTGNPVTSSFSLAKLMWLAANEPENMAKAVVWLAAKDYVRSRLTGNFGTDASDAFNSLVLDPRTLGWRDDLIEAAGLDRSKFPFVHSGADVAGEVSAAAARATGLARGTPVLTGLGDMASLANSFGGSSGHGPTVSLGTSTTLLVTVDKGQRPASGFSVHPVLPGGAWFVLGSLLTGGLALDWLHRIGPVDATRARRGGSLLFLPQLAGMGSPRFAPHFRGSLLGLDPSIGLEDLAQALFDAVAFELRICLEALKAELASPLVLTGGGSAIMRWDQTVADVLGVPVRVPRVRDASAFGAALLAFDQFRASELSARALRSKVVEPRTDWDVEAAFGRYMAARDVMSHFYEPRKCVQDERRTP